MVVRLNGAWLSLFIIDLKVIFAVVWPLLPAQIVAIFERRFVCKSNGNSSFSVSKRADAVIHAYYSCVLAKCVHAPVNQRQPRSSFIPLALSATVTHV